MFNLDHEISAWCRSIYPNWWDRSARVAELADHLYCEVERLQAEGLSEEEAFVSATKRMGDVDALIVEHAKNRSFLLASCDNFANYLEKWRSSMSPKKASMLIIVSSLICAGAILLSTYLMVDTPFEKYSQTVMYLLIALWFIPYSLLSMTATGEQGSVKSDALSIKRKVWGLFNRG